ncbi:hypothetical protein SLS62_001229 [Diatrype stigma]|uniref:F-box domain-containing protein n=1 Tax=Diatrype stigma TaxID=117547 RepID=A0AAN9YTT2_9PEZI
MRPGPEKTTTLGRVDALLYMNPHEPILVAYERDREEHGAYDSAAAGPGRRAWLELVEVGWDPLMKEWAFLLHGACWEIVTTRFGTVDGTGEIALSTGLARILADLNSEWNYPYELVPVSSIVDTQEECIRSLEHRPEPRRYKHTSDIYSGARLDRVKLGEALLEITSRCHVSNTRTPPTQRQVAARTKTTVRPRRSQRSNIPRGQDFFSRLPRELLLCILPHVAFTDLPNLRLASRSIAVVSTLEQLPNSYWTTHFLRDYPYAAPEWISPHTDFRDLCFAMAPLSRPQRWGSPCRIGRRWRGARAAERLLVWNGLDNVSNLLCRTPLGLPVDSLTD